MPQGHHVRIVVAGAAPWRRVAAAGGAEPRAASQLLECVGWGCVLEPRLPPVFLLTER